MASPDTKEPHEMYIANDGAGDELRDAGPTSGPGVYKKYDPKYFNVKYDAKDGFRATEIKIMSCVRPHMRSFHFSWFSFFLAFLAWFAFAPLMPVIKEQFNINKKDIWTVNICSVLSTVMARFLVGPMCDEFGPRTLQCMMMAFGGCMVFIAAIAVHDLTSLAIMRFFIGFVGATFVPCQYWNTLLFTKEVAGTAQAMAGGWGNLGGGATQIVMPLLYDSFLPVSDKETAWRYAFCVPAFCLLAIGGLMFKFADDSPQGQRSGRVECCDFQRLPITRSVSCA
jgi:NNP family nitrate/nitrite transporter-like MFS transporter